MSEGKVIVHKNRTNVLVVDLGQDISADTFTSQIRAKQDHNSVLLMDWDVAFVNTGADGLLELTVDDLITEQIQATKGYMDLKRVTAGEPVPVFDRPLEVEFRGTITV